MELTYENIQQAEKDMEQFDRYLDKMKNKKPEIITKSFKDIFGYEIVLSCDSFKLLGERI